MVKGKFSTYILTNIRKTVLYIGMANNLKRRIKYHKGGFKGFTARYNVTQLVYYEHHPDRKSASKRERQLKNLVRRKKEALVNKFNPNWKDLYDNLD